MAGTDQGMDKTELSYEEHPFADIINFLPDATFVIDRNGIVIAWNQAIEEMTGVPAEKMLGKGDYEYAIPFYGHRRPVLIDLVLKSDEKLEKDFYHIIQKEGDTIIAESDLPRPIGNVVYLWGKASPLYDDKGNRIGAIESIRDVTDRKRAEEALKCSERRLVDIIDHLPDATLAIDNAGKVIAWNRAIEEMTGIKAEDMLGKGDYEYGIPFYGSRRPILIDWIFASDVELEKKYTIIRREGDLIVAEVDLALPDGRNVSLWGKATPLYDDKGNKIGAIESIRDVTDRKQALKVLRQSEDKYRTLFENSGSPLMIIDEDTTITQVNRELEVLSGYNRREVEGKKSWTEFIADPADLEMMVMYHRQRRINPDSVPTTYESRIRNRNGSIRNVIITSVMIPATRQSLAALVDITARKQAEDELHKLYGELECRVIERTAELRKVQESFRQANAKLNLLSSITRHDITNQLTVLLGYLTLLGPKITNPADTEMLEKAVQAAITIQRQIVFTKNYQDIGVKAPQWQDAGTIVAQIMRDLPHPSVAVESDLENLEIFADPLFEKVIYNLMENALRYGERLTRIRFSCRECPDGLQVICDDDGIGIPAEDKRHLFTKGHGKHTGLGLFLSREILSITGITITETGEPGTGARFEMLVPEGGYRFRE